jgi:hypothetical protein
VVVDRDVWSSSGRGTICLIRDMKMCLWVSVFPREPKINEIKLMIVIASTDQKIGGFNITMDNVVRMDVFDTRNLSD